MLRIGRADARLPRVELVFLISMLSLPVEARAASAQPPQTNTSSTQRIPKQIRKPASQRRFIDSSLLRVDPVGVKQPGTSDAQPTVRVKLSASKSAVYVGEDVILTAEPPGTGDAAGIQYFYVFRFGDNEEVEVPARTAGAHHAYWRAGKHTASVLLRMKYRGTYSSDVPGAVDSIIISVDSIPLTATPPRAIVDQEVTFSLEFAGANESGTLYNFSFGDGDTVHSKIPVVPHAYREASVYTAQALITTGDGHTTATKSVQVPVGPAKITPVPDTVWLHVKNDHAEVGDSIQFTAVTGKRHKGLQYRFFFGGKDASEWTSRSSVRHAYKSAGTFSASVEAMSGGEELVTAEEVVITIEGQIPPWLYPVALLAGAFLAWNLLPFPRLGVHARPGRINVTMGGEEKPEIPLEIYLKPNLGNGTYTFPKAPVINERRTHG